ncbi:rod shape-determining protein MreC [Alkalilimnicola ehrlichii]|uniref:rod shape-determining protein MreC n=1 Tax=Alkalilimnicola ehrlichii TaxID=351052 RepID=UPI0012EA7380|nr:rod shape-determining protein MreC [Alkalilimnicola ehrlichii]
MQGPSITVRLVLLALVSVLLMTLDHRQQLADPVRQGLAAVVWPVQQAVSLPIEASQRLGEHLASRQQLVDENRELRRRYLLDQARLQRLQALEMENQRLRDLLGSSGQLGETVLIAELTRVDLDPYSHLIQVDKGSVHQVTVGQAVLDAEGVMGQVDRVGTHGAMVRLITDPSHAIPVEVNRNGLRTIALGTGDLNRLELGSVPINADIQSGDLLVTSGLGGVFPRGYPVAEVERVVLDPGEPFARVSARPLAALDRSRKMVLVQGGALGRMPDLPAVEAPAVPSASEPAPAPGAVPPEEAPDAASPPAAVPGEEAQ